MNWIVGFDLEHQHSGPASLARWLGNASSILAVHVIDDARASFASRDVREQLEQGAYRALDEAIKRAALPSDTERVVTWGGNPEDVIGDLAARREVDGIVISRRTSYGEAKVVRLGRTARRLLRSLPAPVIVVPPELSVDGIGSGPVMLAGDATHDARRAASFASNVGAAAGRAVELLHVYPERFKVGAAGTPTAYLGGMYERYLAQQRDTLQRWLSAYNLGGLKRHETDGPILHRILNVSREHNACMVVCASRQLTTAERIFNSSVGSQLAASAAFPVAVVPGGA